MGKRIKHEEILLYIPNLIGYGRLCLLLLAYFCMDLPTLFVLLYSTSISLDLFDGWAARKFNQCTAFGAWLDVIVDNVSRSCVWTNVAQWGWLIVSIEWITFVCNHQAGSKWREANAKTNPEKVINPPWFVIKIMENGFKTPIGTWVILGLHCLPLWIYAMQRGVTDLFISAYLSIFICIILIGGRCLCLACELWSIRKHILELIDEDIEESGTSS